MEGEEKIQYKQNTERKRKQSNKFIFSRFLLTFSAEYAYTGTGASPTTTVAPIANSKDFSSNGLVTEHGQQISAEDRVEAKMRQVKVSIK